MRVSAAACSKRRKRKKTRPRASARRTLIGSGDRSEKIRTYNFPQSRITDHRINHSIYKMASFMQGEIDEISRSLVEFDRQERLKMVKE